MAIRSQGSSGDANNDSLDLNIHGPSGAGDADRKEYIPNGGANSSSLPVNKDQYKKAPGQINWIGSSYSGVDIKAVAHLYDSGENSIESQIESLNQELAFAQHIQDGCETLIDGGLQAFIADMSTRTTWAAKRKSFLGIIGLPGGDETANEAADFLVDNILKVIIGVNSFPKVLLSTIRIKDAYGATIESLTLDIERLTDLKSHATNTVVLASLQTISIQSHREKFGIRSLGNSYVKGYTRGPRTIAGSMIFTVFNEHSLSSLQRAMGSSSTWADKELSTILPDQLPPIDITIAFANEYGSISELRMYGVEFVNDGITFSIEDLLSENVLQFVARDVDILTSRGNVRLSRLQRGVKDSDITGTSLLHDEAYYEHLDKLGVRRRLLNR